MQSLSGKTAIVTGAGRGIGQAIARAYAAAGASVCCAARSSAEIDATAAAIRQAGGQAFACCADVTVEADVNAMVQQTVERYGGIDILVANAGVDLDQRNVQDSDIGLWRATIETNLTGAYLCARAAIPHLRRRGAGKIIMIGSGLGHRGRPGSAAYACSKAGLWMLTRVLAQELADDNISVNELIPGPVQTAASSVDPQHSVAAQYGSEWRKQPDDVVPLALFLATQPDRGPTAQSYSLMRRDG
ncbi:MAG: SDR family NAD(P)-dependent oxidoreductase [Chloroflexi bacterium]|nr:SDR family NAD(P)-dependent oxidoreductase [Chloroflexota bacterium]MCL5274452.1 SDR family NAD(P)-dependent oxidoreductase [Chloroflexota bacterium]